MAPYYLLVVPADEERVLRCRLMSNDEIVTDPFAERNFGAVMQKRIKEADEFYRIAIPCKSYSPGGYSTMQVCEVVGSG